MKLIKAPYTPISRSCPAGHEPCVKCGSPVRIDDRTRWVHIVNGGSHIAPVGWEHTDQEVARGLDMGLYPIGPACAREYPSDYIR